MLISGPELELCGYGCNDHYLEIDTINHCFESLMVLMGSSEADGIIGDVGMPVIHNGLRYISLLVVNCSYSTFFIQVAIETILFKLLIFLDTIAE